MLTSLYLKTYAEKKEEFENLSFEIDWDVDAQAVTQLYHTSHTIRVKSRQIISLRNRIRVLLEEN